MSDNDKARRRMVVEEVSPSAEDATVNSQLTEEKDELLGVVKEKVEELQDITEHISEDVKESAEVQEEIVEATEKVEPPVPQPAPQLYSEPIYQPKRSTNGMNPLVILIPGVLLLGALLGGIVFYQRGVSKDIIETPITDDNTPQASVAPSASTPPAATVDLKKYTVVIFNGSGISGEAGKVKDLLSTAGFTVGTTGNAATYDYTKTIIKAKSTVDAAYLTKLSEALSKNYVVDKTQTLDSSSKNDVEVVVGTSKAN